MHRALPRILVIGGPKLNIVQRAVLMGPYSREQTASCMAERGPSPARRMISISSVLGLSMIDRLTATPMLRCRDRA